MNLRLRSDFHKPRSIYFKCDPAAAFSTPTHTVPLRITDVSNNWVKIQTKRSAISVNNVFTIK